MFLVVLRFEPNFIVYICYVHRKIAKTKHLDSSLQYDNYTAYMHGINTVWVITKCNVLLMCAKKWFSIGQMFIIFCFVSDLYFCSQLKVISENGQSQYQCVTVQPIHAETKKKYAKRFALKIYSHSLFVCYSSLSCIFSNSFTCQRNRIIDIFYVDSNQLELFSLHYKQWN